ncbi:MAG TPA: hypothetical protein VF187_10190 [Gemmatimonadales bacterium]
MGRSFVLVVLLGSMACMDPEVPAPVVGEWGGDHLGMVASVSGAELEFDCATGRIGAAIIPDASGRFSVTGLHFPGHGGPDPVDEEQVGIPARFDGTVRGDLMTISVTLPDWATTLGPFTLKRGGTPNVLKCL